MIRDERCPFLQRGHQLRCHKLGFAISASAMNDAVADATQLREIVMVEKPGERRLQRRVMNKPWGGGGEGGGPAGMGDANMVVGTADPAHLERQRERLSLAHLK